MIPLCRGQWNRSRSERPVLAHAERVRIGRSQRFEQARPFLVLGLALAAWLVAPIAVKTAARASFFEMTAPVVAASSYVNDLQKFWALRLHSKDELIEAGRDMAG